MHRASLTIGCGDQAEARVLHGAVSVEAQDGPEGTTTSLAVEADGLRLDVTAEDVAGLRAALHSVLRLLDAARRTA